MDSIAIALFALSEEDIALKQDLKLQRRLLRDSFNPFKLDDKVFIKNFRLNKVAFKYVLNELEDDLGFCVYSSSITPTTKLAPVLRFIAEGSYQYGVGKDFEIGIAQSTFSTCLKSVLSILERKLCPKWIQKREDKLDFYSKARFPGTVMCVDGTHIKIRDPTEEKFLYYNRKGYFSTNAMVICDNKMRIRFVDARYPGSNHDAHVLALSSARAYFQQKFQEDERNTWIIGDAGYPLEPWLTTPYRSPEIGSPQSIFNQRHSKTRNIVERVFGVLKNRSRCLLSAKELHYSPQKAAQTMNVASALHNICIHFKVETELRVIEIHNEDTVEDGEVVESNLNSVASNIRDNILRSFI